MPREHGESAEIPETAGFAATDVVQPREYRVGRAFVQLADTLVDDFDLADFLHMLVEQCVDLLEVDAAGVLLAGQGGGVRMAAASSERAELLEVFVADTQDGPCVECIRTGRTVTSHDLAGDPQRWPRFAAAASTCGYRAAIALPLRLRREVIGALSLLDTQPNGVHSMAAQLGQALADVATIGILQQRAIDHAGVVAEQLQSALTSRVIIEQAKGMLAAHSNGRLIPDEAFAALRGYGRSHHRRLTELAAQVVDGTAEIDQILAHPLRRGRADE